MQHVEREIAVRLLDFIHQVEAVLHVHLPKRKRFFQEIRQQFATHVHTPHSLQHYVAVDDGDDLL